MSPAVSYLVQTAAEGEWHPCRDSGCTYSTAFGALVTSKFLQKFSKFKISPGPYYCCSLLGFCLHDYLYEVAWRADMLFTSRCVMPLMY